MIFMFKAMLVFPAIAQAYVGPGLGVVMVWSLLGPIAGLISAVLIVAYFPARYYYKKYKKARAEREGTVAPNAGEAQASREAEADEDGD